MEAARLLRENPAQKVAEIAESCGFFNIKHFYHVFRQTYGLSPGSIKAARRPAPTACDRGGGHG